MTCTTSFIAQQNELETLHRMVNESEGTVWFVETTEPHDFDDPNGHYVVIQSVSEESYELCQRFYESLNSIPVKESFITRMVRKFKESTLYHNLQYWIDK